jgi:hypothetical protein
VEKLRKRAITFMKGAQVRSNGGVVAPVFLAGLGAGVVLTLLLRPGGAFRNCISGKVKDGALQ